MRENYIDEIIERAQRIDITVDKHQAALLEKHLDLVLERNKDINLTSIDSKDEALTIHIIDSLSVLPLLDRFPKGHYCDLGSGGGYPGIPISIMSERIGTLVDSSKKKVKILDYFISELGLQRQLRTYGDRIETLAKEEPSSYDIVVARALTSLPSLLELASPLLKEGGELVAMKGRPTKEEMEFGNAVAARVGFHLEETHEVKIGSTIMRAICVYRKTGASQVKLPRRIGLAQHKPLI